MTKFQFQNKLDPGAKTERNRCRKMALNQTQDQTKK